MDSLLEKYIESYSTAWDPLLEELYRETHIRFVNPNMISGQFQGKLLEFMTHMICPENVLEIGTFTGYSAICMAKGLSEGSKLITVELNDELEAFSRSYMERAGVSDRIVQLTGNALEIIPGIDQVFDMVFIDGDKREYCDYFRLVRDKVRPGGFIIADNVLWGNKVFDKDTTDTQTLGIIKFNEMIAKEQGIENILLPVRDGLMIIRKL